MAFIQWSDEIYSVGIRKIDEQHKQLIGLIDALHEQRGSTNKEFIDRVFATLIQYTKKHFVDEERLLEKLHWNHLEAHQAQHAQFIKTITDMKALYETNEVSSEMVVKLSEFLKTWLTKHILVEDKAYARYLES